MLCKHCPNQYTLGGFLPSHKVPLYIFNQNNSHFPLQAITDLISIIINQFYLFCNSYNGIWALPGGSDGKEYACNAGDLGSIPGLGRFPGEGNGYPVQYSCLENPLERGGWQVTVHRIVKNQTCLNWLSTQANTHNGTYSR